MSLRRRENWYLRGWEYRENAQKNGRPGGDLVYVGEYYSFHICPAALVRLKAAYAVLTAAFLILYVLLSLETPTGSRTVWGGACILTIIPLMYLLMGCYCLLRSEPKMTDRSKHASWSRVHYASMLSTFLLGIAAVGELVYLLHVSVPPAVDVRWLLELTACLACSCGILILSCRFPARMVLPEPSGSGAGKEYQGS